MGLNRNQTDFTLSRFFFVEIFYFLRCLMQLINQPTFVTLSAISITKDISCAISAIAVNGGKEIIELGRDSRPYTISIAAHVYVASKRFLIFYNDHLHHRLRTLGQIAIALLTLLGMIALLAYETGWTWVKQFVRDQYADSNFFSEGDTGFVTNGDDIDDAHVTFEIICVPINWGIWQRDAKVVELRQLCKVCGIENAAKLKKLDAMTALFNQFSNSI